MPNVTRAAGWSLVLWLATTLAATTAAADRTAEIASAPRRHVAAIAEAIQAHYYDADRGGRIAAELRAAADAGTFDALQDERDLATALTGRLRPLDRHFAVRWSPPDAAMSARQPSARSLSPSARDRRANYGIRRAELLPCNVGYLDLRQFAHFEFGRPDAPARRAIEGALQMLADADALIIDLRHNGGGSPAMVGYLTSAFTPCGADIHNVFHSRAGTTNEAPGDCYSSPRLEIPLYLLTSARTGSAAEAFAYTLKNAGRATVVGEATAGAANPGTEFDTGSGFHVFISTGSPVSPITGRNWEGDGVQPDVAMPQADALHAARILALETLLERDLPAVIAVETRWALETLRAATTTTATTSEMPLDDYSGSYGPSVVIGRQDGRLFLRSGRRPPLPLLPIENDLFASVDDPSLRVRFERNAKGQVVALDTLSPDGASSRFRRGD